MKIFAIVVTYNGMRWYDRCFGSLRNSDMPVETIVIDNASTDETVSYIKEHFHEVCLIESKENLGFAKANNIGIKRALDNGADYVFLLNQDAWVEKDTLTKLVQTFDENENVGIASPIHLNGEYTGLDLRFAKFIMNESMLSDAYMKHIKKYYKISFANAAAWLLSAKCIRKVGGFDTLLFVHYGEDVNYCQRVLYHDFSVVVNTQCTICHDRKERIADNNVGRGLWQEKNVNVQEKVNLGNINNDLNINKQRRYYYRLLFKSIIKFNRLSMKEIRRKIALLNIVQESRKKNIKGGMAWL